MGNKGLFSRRVSAASRGRDSPKGSRDRSPRRIATWAASGVAVPRAFFGTFFRFEKKVLPHRGGSTVRAGVGASSSTRGKGYGPAGAQRAFSRGNNRRGSHCRAPVLVVCLNDRSLTAFGGCIHWIPASLRSPLETFGHRSWRENYGTAALPSAPESTLPCRAFANPSIYLPTGKPAHSATSPPSCTPNPTEWIFS